MRHLVSGGYWFGRDYFTALFNGEKFSHVQN
jgi:hypothetical protein